MVRWSVILPITLAAGPLMAQIPATTADGRAVLLYDNGVWKYAASADSIPANQHSNRTAKLDLLHGKAVLRYDPAKWVKGASDTEGRILLTHVNGDGVAIVIAERLGMPLETLRALALDNARKASPDLQVISEKTIEVDGQTLLEMQFSGTLQGIPFTYLGRYYAGEAGAVQLLTSTGSNLFAEYEVDFREFLNGFEVKE